jgi:hypothetical protein
VVLGIVSGALEIADGISKGDRAMFAKGVIDVSAGALALASILLDGGSEFGPLGLAAALLALGGMAAYNALAGEREVPDAPPMNRVLEALVWRLQNGHDTKPFLGFLLANEEHGDDLGMVLFKLDPNGA